MPASPRPVPRSSTRLPRTSAGLDSTSSASATEPCHSVAQCGSSSGRPSAAYMSTTRSSLSGSTSLTSAPATGTTVWYRNTGRWSLCRCGIEASAPRASFSATKGAGTNAGDAAAVAATGEDVRRRDREGARGGGLARCALRAVGWRPGGGRPDADGVATFTYEVRMAPPPLVARLPPSNARREVRLAVAFDAKRKSRPVIRLFRFLPVRGLVQTLDQSRAPLSRDSR